MRNIYNISKVLLVLYFIFFNLSCSLFESGSEDDSGIIWVECSGNEISDTVYFVSNSGDDNNNGITEESAYKTILKAFKSVRPGGAIKILEGIYKESIGIESCGSLTVPILIEGYNGIPILDGENIKTIGIFFEKSDNYII